MLKQAKDLLSFKAFKPSKLDVKVPLVERFRGGGPLMGLSVSRYSLTCAEIEFKEGSEANVSKVKTFPLNRERQGDRASDEEQLTAITSFAMENGLSYVVLLNSPEIEVIKLEISSNKIGVDRLYGAMHSIGNILKEEPEKGRVYAYVSNPKSEETLVFSYDQEKIDCTVDLVNKAGLEVVRAGCSIYGVIDYLVNENREFLSNNQILLIYSSDCLLIASILEGRFQQVSFRANIENPDVESYIPRMIERLEYMHSQVSCINCSDWDLKTYFSLHYPTLEVRFIFPDNFKGIFRAVSHG